MLRFLVYFCHHLYQWPASHHYIKCSQFLKQRNKRNEMVGSIKNEQNLRRMRFLLTQMKSDFHVVLSCRYIAHEFLAFHGTRLQGLKPCTTRLWPYLVSFPRHSTSNDVPLKFWLGVIRGHWKMAPFDRSHRPAISYSSANVKHLVLS